MARRARLPRQEQVVTLSPLSLPAHPSRETKGPALSFEGAGIYAFSAATGVVSAAGVSFIVPDPFVAGFAGGCALLVPSLVQWLFDADSGPVRAFDWLAERRFERQEERAEAETDRALRILEARKAVAEAANERTRLHLRVQEYNLALDKGPIAAGIAGKAGKASALLAQTNERRRWEPIVRFAYANQGKAVTSGIPWAKGKIGAARFNRLAELGAIARLGDSKLYQWQYSITGETEAEAMHWLEAHGFMSMEG